MNGELGAHIDEAYLEIEHLVANSLTRNGIFGYQTFGLWLMPWHPKYKESIQEKHPKANLVSKIQKIEEL